MKSVFLSILLYAGMFLGHDSSTPFLGKWHNISEASPIKEVVFLNDKNVKFSNNTYSLVQRYQLSANNASNNSFSGHFRLINVGKIVKESEVELRLLKKDLMELVVDDKVLILKRY